MAKPNKVPTWATDGGAEVTEPSAGKRAIGWILERPAYQYFNWLFNLIGQWLGFLDAQFVDGGLNRINSGTTFPAAPNDNDVFLLLTNDNTEVGIFIYRANATDEATGIMVYDGPGGPLEPGRWLHVAYTVAGEYHGVAPLDAQYKVPNTHLRLGEANGPASLDASAKVPNEQTRRGEADGLASLGSDGKVPGSQLAGLLAQKHGVFDTGSTPGHISGSEVFTFDISGSVPSDRLRVVFATAMPHNNYTVNASSEAPGIVPFVTNKNVAFVEFEAWSITSGAKVDLKSIAHRLTFSLL